jgi:hypothetical protein
MIRNVLFVVEGQTEGLATAFGKGLWNILRYESDFMRQQSIRHHLLPKNGKYELLADIGFDVSQHLNPPKKKRQKLQRQGSPIGDYVFILRDLDCEDESNLHQEILDEIDTPFHHQIEIHFAVQEIEAWMIAHPEGFCSLYKNAPRQLIHDIKNLVPQNQSPEVVIDCDPKPAEHLKMLTQRNGLKYRKTIEGPQALKKVEPDIVAARCPHFQNFRDALRKQIGYSA